jgi:hypothetical protein
MTAVGAPQSSMFGGSGIDPETLLEHAIAGVLILALVFVEEIDIFLSPPPHASPAEHQKNKILFRAVIISLVVGTGVLAGSHPHLAIMSALLIAAIVMVRSRSHVPF